MSFLIRNNGDKKSNLGIKRLEHIQRTRKNWTESGCYKQTTILIEPKYKIEIKHEESQIQITRTNLVAL